MKDETIAAELAELRQRQDRMFRVLEKQSEVFTALAAVVERAMPKGVVVEVATEDRGLLEDLSAALSRKVR